MTSNEISRRTLTGLAAAGLGLPLLAACGDDGDSAVDGAGSSGSTGSSSPSTATSSAAPSESGGASSAAPAGEALASTGDIEVGGGTIFADEEKVVTQPTAGEFKCFTSICSHQGCPVTDVSDGTIN